MFAATTLLQDLYHYLDAATINYEKNLHNKEQMWCTLFLQYQQNMLEQLPVTSILQEMHKLDIFHFLTWALDVNRDKKEMEKWMQTEEHRIIYQSMFDFEHAVIESVHVSHPVTAFIILLTSRAFDMERSATIANIVLQQEQINNKYLQSLAWFCKADDDIPMLKLALKKYDRNIFALRAIMLELLQKEKLTEAKEYHDQLVAINPHIHDAKMAYHIANDEYEIAEEEAFLEIKHNPTKVSLLVLAHAINLSGMHRKRSCQEVIQQIQELEILNDQNKIIVACCTCILFNNIELLKKQVSAIRNSMQSLVQIFAPFVSIMELLPTLYDQRTITDALQVLPKSIDKALAAHFLYAVTGFFHRTSDFLNLQLWIPLATAFMTSPVHVKFAASNPREALLLIASNVGAENPPEHFKFTTKSLANDITGKELISMMKESNPSYFN